MTNRSSRDYSPHITVFTAEHGEDHYSDEYDVNGRLTFHSFEEAADWLMTRNPSPEINAAAPEVVEDWIGASAPKEPGAEPVLMHREELTKDVKAMIQHVETVEPEHPYERWDRRD